MLFAPQAQNLLLPLQERENRLNQQKETAQRLKSVSEGEERTTVDKTENVEYSVSQRSPDGLTDDQIAILHALADRPCQIDELVERTQIPARRVLSALTMLQLDGCVEERPGKRFAPLVRLTRE